MISAVHSQLQVNKETLKVGRNLNNQFKRRRPLGQYLRNILTWYIYASSMSEVLKRSVQWNRLFSAFASIAIICSELWCWASEPYYESNNVRHQGYLFTFPLHAPSSKAYPHCTGNGMSGLATLSLFNINISNSFYHLVLILVTVTHFVVQRIRMCFYQLMRFLNVIQ